MSDLDRDLDLPYDEAIARITATLAEQGFGIITRIDVKEVFKKKIDQDFRRYDILGACNPKFAFQALSASLDVGTLLPCNVIAYETDDGRTHLTAVDPRERLPAGTPALQKLAAEVRERLVLALAAA